MAPSSFTRPTDVSTPTKRTAAASIRAYRSSADCRTQRPERGGGRWKATAPERPAKRRKQARLSVKALPQSAPRNVAYELRRSPVCALRAENTMGGPHIHSLTPPSGVPSPPFPTAQLLCCRVAAVPRSCSSLCSVSADAATPAVWPCRLCAVPADQLVCSPGGGRLLYRPVTRASRRWRSTHRIAFHGIQAGGCA